MFLENVGLIEKDLKKLTATGGTVFKLTARGRAVLRDNQCASLQDDPLPLFPNFIQSAQS